MMANFSSEIVEVQNLNKNKLLLAYIRFVEPRRIKMILYIRGSKL